MQPNILDEISKMIVQQQNQTEYQKPNLPKDGSLTEIKMSKMSMFNNTQYLYSPTLTENSCHSAQTYPQQ